MANLENKEKEFAAILADVTREARENQNTISSDYVKEAFAELELDDQQIEQVNEYLRKHNIGIDEAPDIDEYLSSQEHEYLNEYIDSIKELADISDSEKEATIISAMAGDKASQMRVIEIFLPMIPDIAKLYAEQGVLIEDLIGEGNEALTKGAALIGAIEAPSEAEEFLGKFVMDAMESLVNEATHEKARDMDVVNMIQEVADKAAELAQDLRRKVTVDELVKESGLKEDYIREALRLSGDLIEDIERDQKG